MKFNSVRHCLLLSLLIQPVVSDAVSSKITLTSVCEPLTTLNINGVDVPRLLIDTGASGGIHLKESLIKRLPGNPAKNETHIEGTDAYGQHWHKTSYVAPQLTINGVQQANVPLTSFTLWGLMHERQKQEPINGVIGLDAFGDNVLVIDLQKMILDVVTHVQLDDLTQWEKLPITRTDYGAEIDAIGEAGKHLRMVIDTGTNRSLLLAKESENLSTGSTEVIAGKKQVIDVIRAALHAPELAIDGFIGCDFLKGKRLVIDKDHVYVSSN